MLMDEWLRIRLGDVGANLVFALHTKPGFRANTRFAPTCFVSPSAMRPRSRGNCRRNALYPLTTPSPFTQHRIAHPQRSFKLRTQNSELFLVNFVFLCPGKEKIQVFTALCFYIYIQ